MSRSFGLIPTKEKKCIKEKVFKNILTLNRNRILEKPKMSVEEGKKLVLSEKCPLVKVK